MLFAEESIKAKPGKALTELETVFTEELEVKPVEVPAEMAELVEIPDSCANRPLWWSQCDKSSYGSSVSDTSKLSDDELEDTVMNLQQQSKDQETVSKSEESDYDESEDADQGLC